MNFFSILRTSRLNENPSQDSISTFVSASSDGMRDEIIWLAQLINRLAVAGSCELLSMLTAAAY
jgi:hypothetical protein